MLVDATIVDKIPYPERHGLNFISSVYNKH